MTPGLFQGKKFPFTPKRRGKSLGSQCNNIIDTRHDLAAFRSKLANVPWLRSYNFAANQVSEVYKVCTDGDVSHATSPQTAQRCLIEASLTAFELFVLEEIHGCEDLVLGLDGTSTYFGRAFNEFHISGKTETELIGMLDCVGKTALDMLNQFILVWAKVNDVEARFSLPRTPLYTISSLTADTTTAMSGEFGGFQALFERAR